MKLLQNRGGKKIGSRNKARQLAIWQILPFFRARHLAATFFPPFYRARPPPLPHKKNLCQETQYYRQMPCPKKRRKRQKIVKSLSKLRANSQMSCLILKAIPLKNDMFCLKRRKILAPLGGVFRVNKTVSFFLGGFGDNTN